MTERDPNAGSAKVGATFSDQIAVPIRESLARRRRSSQRRHNSTWVLRSSRKRLARTVVVCVGVLILMGLGLYFGLAHQDNGSPEGAARVPAVFALGRASV